MRAKEFLKEQTTLPPEQADPMNHVFTLPGVQSSDPYQIYRLGVAMARAKVMLARMIQFHSCQNGLPGLHLEKMRWLLVLMPLLNP